MVQYSQQEKMGELLHFDSPKVVQQRRLLPKVRNQRRHQKEGISPTEDDQPSHPSAPMKSSTLVEIGMMRERDWYDA